MNADLDFLELPPVNTIVRVKVVMYTAHNPDDPPIRMCRVRNQWCCALEYLQRPEDLAINRWRPTRFRRTDLSPFYPQGGLVQNLTETWRQFWEAVVIQRWWRCVRKRIRAANRIKRILRKVITDPAFSACQQRLLHEYSKLSEVL